MCLLVDHIFLQRFQAYSSILLGRVRCTLSYVFDGFKYCLAKGAVGVMVEFQFELPEVCGCPSGYKFGSGGLLLPY